MVQWGRDLSIAEISLNLIGNQFINKLQWGRDLSIAETD